jgi:predicted transcriptional regulator
MTLVELTASIIASQAASSSMTTEELIKSIQLVHASLKSLESGDIIPEGTTAPTATPTMTLKKAFGKNEVFCMICGKGFKTLKRHIAQAHDLKPGTYRKQFGIPSTQSLVAKNYSESRRQSAIDKGLGTELVKARATRKANAAEKATAAAPVKKTKSSVPMGKKKSVLAAKKTAAPVENPLTYKREIAITDYDVIKYLNADKLSRFL